MMRDEEINEAATEVRKSILEMLLSAGSGHSAGPLGSADFWAALYFGGVLRYKPNDPWWEDRDRVVVDCGHYAPVVYATLAKAGYFPKEELLTLRSIGTRLQGHPHARILPGIETSSGPLGQGMSQAVGMALAMKLLKKNSRVFCFASDGGHNEGQIWEAYLCAVKYGLSNLTIIVDRNGIQIDGPTETVMPLFDLSAKIRGFGLEVKEVDGHNVGQILETLRYMFTVTERPQVIVLRTIPGKGVEFMEGDYNWHGKAPNAGEVVEGLKDINEIRTLGGRIVSEHE